MDIKKKIQSQLSTELNKMTVAPDIKSRVLSDQRLTIMIALLDHSQALVEEKVAIITAISLLHLSLDIHSNVSNNDDIRNAVPILQGDQLGAQYYSLLTKHNQTQLTHRLAQATKEINQLKIQLEGSIDCELDSLHKLRAEIESKIMIQLIQYTNLNQFERYFFELSYFYLLQFARDQASQAWQLSKLDQLLNTSQSSIITLEKQLRSDRHDLTNLIKTELNDYYLVQAKIG